MVPSFHMSSPPTRYSPRIRGDGPFACDTHKVPRVILPVFAGMVPHQPSRATPSAHSPRIRGDGPVFLIHQHVTTPFSPYSRGWSPWGGVLSCLGPILPVFAGMVRGVHHTQRRGWDSPRIRGDGPKIKEEKIPEENILPVFAGMVPRRYLETPWITQFSPYSRGWSHQGTSTPQGWCILPVFAGMVPVHSLSAAIILNSPRIRGDGPNERTCP